VTDDGDDSHAGRPAGRRAARLGSARSPAPRLHAPRHRARATRTAGRRMRSRLLDTASALFKAHGLGGASIGAIAAAADAFPSQVTYYFGTKEALFVEAACRDMLHIAGRVEKAGARARTPEAYARALVDTVVGADGLPFFIEALSLTRQRSDLAPQIARMWRARAPMRGRWPGTAGAPSTRPTSPRAGSGRSPSALHWRVTPPAAARRRCPPRCAKPLACWPRRRGSP
jgi:AcrR family transcriptional regulator